MSAITNVWRQLVQRRLWPVAILLIAALAAVPLALAEQPEPAAPAPQPVPVSDEAALATEPIVAQASAADRGKRRKVLGSPKNPFGVVDATSGSAEPPDSAGSTTAQDPAPVQTGDSPSGGGSSPSGGSGESPSGGTTEPPAEEKPAPKQYELYELTVRFGESTGGSERRTLKRLEPLPSADAPVLIYLGVMRDGETAVFLVDHGISAVGDGDCNPTPETCETIRLRVGDTEFLDVKGPDGTVTAQYQLDLIKIHKRDTTSAVRAHSSSKAGKRALRARVAADGPIGYRWDPSSGALQRRAGKQVRGSAAATTLSLP